MVGEMKIELPGFARRAINALPDFNGQPFEVQAVSGVLFSLLVHLLLLSLWIFVKEGWIGKLIIKLPKPEIPIEILIQTAPPPEREIVPLDQLPEKQRIDSEGLARANEAPSAAKFQSDVDLMAGSQQRPRGTAPLPQTSARREVADKSLVQREARAGSTEPRVVSASVNRMGSKSPEPKLSVTNKKRTPQPQPSSESSKMGDAEDLGGELVFRKVASGVSAPVKVIERLGSGKKVQSVQDFPDDLFQEGKQQTKVDGGLSENGKNGVNASKTPLAAYMKLVSRAIGARWNQVIKTRMDSLETGSVRVRFRVDAEGGVREVNLEHSTANREFSDLCIEVVRAADLDPPPPEAAPLLKNGLLEIPFTFSLY